VNEVESTPVKTKRSHRRRHRPCLGKEETVRFWNRKSDAIQRPTFSDASSVSVNQHYGLHIMLPASASNSPVPASIVFSPTLRGGHSYQPQTASHTPVSPSIASKKVSSSVPSRRTSPHHRVEHSAIVVSCRQFRMHSCVDVDVYLSCSSNPIIEDCSRIRFGRIPKAYVSGEISYLSAFSNLLTDQTLLGP